MKDSYYVKYLVVKGYYCLKRSRSKVAGLHGSTSLVIDGDCNCGIVKVVGLWRSGYGNELAMVEGCRGQYT